MKKIAMLAVMLITAVTFTFAQNEKGRDRKLTPEQRTEMMMKKLNENLSLSAEQYKQIREVVLARELKREENNGVKDDREKFTGEINKYLTPEQREKWIALKKERHDKKHDKKDMKHDHDDHSDHNHDMKKDDKKDSVE